MPECPHRGKRLALTALITAAASAVLWLGAASAFSPGGIEQPILRRGSHGSLVRDWQVILNQWLSSRPPAIKARGQLGGGLAEDGVFGLATELATRQWAREAHLPATGIVGLAVWVRWIGSNVTCCGAGYPNLDGRLSPRPDAYIGWWQLALDRWLEQQQLPRLTINGLYDSATQRVTARFQRSHGLVADGIAGRATWLQMRRVRGAMALP